MTAVCLVGCGRWGRHILRDLVSLGAEVHVVARSDATQRAALAGGAKSAQSDLSAVPADIAGYVVATPTTTHTEIIDALVPTGKPIFVEKPMTCDVEAARRLVRAAGDRLFVMDKWRYHPGIEAIAAMARSGELGEVLAIRSYRLGWSHAHRDVDAIWILIPHDLSIALEILGYLPPPRAAWAPVAGRANCDMIAVLADAEGPQVTIDVATSQPLYRRSILVVGDRKVVQLGDSYDDKIVVMEGRPDRPGSVPQELTVGTEMPLLAELRVFLDHLRGGAAPRSSAAEGLLIVERITALRALAGLDQKAG